MLCFHGSMASAVKWKVFGHPACLGSQRAGISLRVHSRWIASSARRCPVLSRCSKAHLPLTCTDFRHLSTRQRPHGLSRAAAGGGSWRWRRNPCMAHESKCRLLRSLSHATLRGFVALFRTVRGFFRDAARVFLALGAALIEDGNSSLDCFEVRWWP